MSENGSMRQDQGLGVTPIMLWSIVRSTYSNYLVFTIEGCSTFPSKAQRNFAVGLYGGQFRNLYRPYTRACLSEYDQANSLLRLGIFHKRVVRDMSLGF